MAKEPVIQSDQDFAVGGNNTRSPEVKSLSMVVQVAIDQWIRNNLNVWLPAKIVSVRSNSFVDVQPLIQEQFIVQGAISLPVLLNVPVEHPRGKDYWIKLPIAVGDTGRVSFCDRSLDTWLVNGGGPINPEDTRMHHLSDAVFTPGIYPQSDVLPGDPTQLILNNGDTQIVLGNDGTFLFNGAGGQELMSILSDLAAACAAIANSAGPTFNASDFASIQTRLTELMG